MCGVTTYVSQKPRALPFAILAPSAVCLTIIDLDIEKAISDRSQVKGEDDWEIDQVQMGEYPCLDRLLVPLTGIYRYCFNMSVLATSRIGCGRRRR